MRVQLQRDWKQYEKGEYLTEGKDTQNNERPFYTLRFLVRQGWAVDVTHEVFKKPTMSNTKKEIEQHLDAREIEYDEYATKAELLELI